MTVTHAGGNAVLHGPSHGLRVIAVSGNIGEVRRTTRRGLAHGPPQHRHHLGAVDGGVVVRAVGNALVLGPVLCLFVPGVTAVQVRAVLPRKDRPKLGAGGGGVGRVDRGAHAVHQSAGAHEVDLVLGPVVLRIDEALGVVNDLHRRAAVHGQLDTVLGGNGILQNFLRAVGVDEHRHRTGGHVGNRNFHLGLARALGKLDAHRGGGAAVLGGLDLHRNLDRLAVLLRVLNSLAADLGRRLGLAVFVDFHRAGGAVSGLVLGDGTAVLLRLGLGHGAVLAGGGLGHRAVSPGLGLGGRAVGIVLRLRFNDRIAVMTLASKKKPLLLVVEDIQWIDSMSLALLDQALHKIGPEKFVFAATCRQPCGKEVERFLRNVEEDELCSLLSLAAFTYEETMQFIELCGARGIVLQDKDRIYHDTQGNAFLLTQLIGSIMENGQPKVLPHSMDEILSYRLSGLSFEGRQVLNLVAMFPDYAPYRVLEVVSSKPTLDLLYVCQELCRRAILNEVYDGGSLSLVFTQAEFRDLTYSHIPALSRRILHLNIAQALSALDSAAMPNLDTLTAYHYEQGGDAFHAFQYKVRRFRTYVFFNYALLNGMPSSSESLLDSTPEALESFQKMKKELCHLQRLHPEDSALKAAETDLYYSIGCFCIYRGLYEQGVSAIRKLLQNPALSEEARDLAHEQMIFYGIQTYQTNVMRENIDAALSLTKGKNAARYAINRRYNGYLLVMEGRYEDAREELLRTLVLLHDSAEDEVERRLQSAYAHDYIGEAYRKQGMYARAIEEYQIAIDMIGEYPTSTSTPIFYVDWAMASLAIGDYAAAHNALSNSNRAADNVKEPTGYFRTLYCACNALMCFADGDYRHCASEILQCEQLTKALIVPYDTGILYLTKALLCCYSAQLDIAETPLADVLTEDIAYYCAHCRKCMAGGKAGAFEQELLKRLECGCSDPLPGFLQVTKN